MMPKLVRECSPDHVIFIVQFQRKQCKENSYFVVSLFVLKTFCRFWKQMSRNVSILKTKVLFFVPLFFRAKREETFLLYCTPFGLASFLLYPFFRAKREDNFLLYCTPFGLTSFLLYPFYRAKREENFFTLLYPFWLRKSLCSKL